MKRVVSYLIVGVMCIGIGVGASVLYKADDIKFTPNDSTWNVSNVSDAINDIYYGSGTSSGSITITWHGDDYIGKEVIATLDSYTVKSIVSSDGISTLKLPKEGYWKIECNGDINYVNIKYNYAKDFYASPSIALNNSELKATSFTLSTSDAVIDGNYFYTTNAKGISGKISDDYTPSFTNDSFKIEFDANVVSSSNIDVLFSFGGSNTSGGAVEIKNNNTFQYYAGGYVFTKSLGYTLSGEHHFTLEFTTSYINLYMDDELISSGAYSSYTTIKNYISNKNVIAVGYNQSAHSEYTNWGLNNIKFVFD